MSRPFLGVARSALGRTWVERCDAAQGTIALAIAQIHGLPDVLSRVLAGRGVEIADVEGFLSPRLRDLMPDPHIMTGMEVAANRLADAVLAREKVAIFGDYDVDGACSAALLAEYLRACGLDYMIHIPDRITEGYGPNVDAIRSAQGAGCRAPRHGRLRNRQHRAAWRRRKALGSMRWCSTITRRRSSFLRLSPIVNPNRLDDLSGLGHLCAAGVVFLTLVALNRTLRDAGFFQGRPEPDLLGSVDLVALATVADVVPLVGLNRAFVRQGLIVMRGRGRPGLAALLDVAGLAGRARMLASRVSGRAAHQRGRPHWRRGAWARAFCSPKIRSRLPSLRASSTLLNRERQAIEVEAVAEAEAQAHVRTRNRARPADPRDLLAEWHPGVVGLIAARTKERFRRRLSPSP